MGMEKIKEPQIGASDPELVQLAKSIIKTPEALNNLREKYAQMLDAKGVLWASIEKSQKPRDHIDNLEFSKDLDLMEDGIVEMDTIFKEISMQESDSNGDVAQINNSIH